MGKGILILIVSACLCSCKTSPNADKLYSDSRADKTYQLKLNPSPGSLYKYEIKNEMEMKMEVEDKKIDNVNRTTVTVNYTVNKDSLGNFVMRVNYEKIHLYTKSGEEETDLDVSNALYSINPIEKMLGYLKEATIEATISPSGEVKSVKGYQELGARILTGMNDLDANSRKSAQAQWDKVIGDGLIRKNMKDLFAFFPDSTVHEGDKWKIQSKQNGELPMNVTTIYRLQEITDGIAILSVKADIASEPGIINYMGSDVTADLKGEQDGEYQMDIKTGMLKSCDINSKVKGQLEVMGRDVPITILTSVTMNKIN